MRARPADSRAAPHDLEAERAVLGAILLDNTAVNPAGETLTPEDFYGEAHRVIFAAMMALSEDDSAIDPVTVAERLERSGQLERAGGLGYLSTLMDRLPRALNISSYAAIVKEKSSLRNLIAVGDSFITKAMNGQDEAAEIVEAAYQDLDAATNGNGRPTSSGLEFVGVNELAAKVDAAGSRRWLIRPIWVEADYGIFGAVHKGQKTWAAVDAAVSVASGTPWLGYFSVDDAGPVLMFAGAGGEGNIIRRLRAIAEGRGLAVEDLPITICPRAPHLNDANHLRQVAQQVEKLQPRLVILDPLYLAANGASLSDLYSMGALLEALQHICQDHGAALFIITHFNRKEGKGPDRFTGAGPAEWGRVLISADVVSRRTDPTSKATDVITEMEIIGGEVPDQQYRVHRKIWSDDPDDLDSPLHVETIVTQSEGASQSDGERSVSPAARKVLEALTAAENAVGTLELGDYIADKYGNGLRRETMSRALTDLKERGVVIDIEDGPFKPKLWQLVQQESA